MPFRHSKCSFIEKIRILLENKYKGLAFHFFLISEQTAI